MLKPYNTRLATGAECVKQTANKNEVKRILLSHSPAKPRSKLDRPGKKESQNESLTSGEPNQRQQTISYKKKSRPESESTDTKISIVLNADEINLQRHPHHFQFGHYHRACTVVAVAGSVVSVCLGRCVFSHRDEPVLALPRR